MIDTHAHLDFPEFDSDRDELIKSFYNNGVKFIVNIGVDLETSKASIALAEKYKPIYAAVGYHPHDSKHFNDEIYAEIKSLAKHPKVVAIGEIGLDFFRDRSPRDVQIEVFKRQLDLADELNMPVVLHIREAIEQAYEILRERKRHAGVLHAFPGDREHAAVGVAMGYHIAFGGPITYPNSDRSDVAATVPISRIVTETDCPYLPPQKYRGKRNQPKFIMHTIDKLAEVFPKYRADDIERITELNAARMFKLPLDNPPKAVYRIGDSLYINLTMRCTNNCYFCVKNQDGHVAGHNLNLSHEPTEEEILTGIETHKGYTEIVFCGLGEPTLRAALMLKLASVLKDKEVPIRLDTNGQGSLINKTDLPSKMAGLIDSVSVSLNAENAPKYAAICKPQFGENAYEEVLRFAAGCREMKIKTVLSVVEIPEINLEKCRKVAVEIGVPIRVRKYVTVQT